MRFKSFRVRDVLRYAPTRRYAALTALCAPVWLLSGTDTGLAIAVAVSVSVILIGLVDALRLPGQPHLEVTRSLPSIVGVGEEVSGAYQIQSSWGTPVVLRIAHALPEAVQQIDPRQDVPQGNYLACPPISKTTPARVPFTIRGEHRGVYQLGTIALVVKSRLGFVQRALLYYQNDTVSVIPAFVGNKKYRLAALQQRTHAAGERSIRHRGTSTAFNNLRDYVIGDDPRHIDWKASARRGRLISREFAIEQGQTIMIAVDAGRMMTQFAGDRPRFEYALSSALTLADVALTAGDRVGLLIFNEEVREYLPPSRSARTLTNIRDSLVRGTATMAEPDYAAAFRTLAARQRRRALIVLFTDVIDIRSSRAVIANTTRSVGRHLPLVVALQNEQLTTAAIPVEQGNALSTYGSAAAEELLTAREEALLSMRQAGVSVLDTPPAAMTSALINRYLEIKDRALL